MDRVMYTPHRERFLPLRINRRAVMRKLRFLGSCLPTIILSGHLINSFRTGAIKECSVLPSSLPKSLPSTLRASCVLLLFSAATGSFPSLLVYVYSLYLVISTSRPPCLAYASIKRYVRPHPLSMDQLTAPAILLWPALWLYQVLDKSFGLFEGIDEISSDMTRYVHFCLACTLPRLLFGGSSPTAHAGIMIGYRRRAIAVAVFYIWAETLLSTRVQWLLHALQPGAPFPTDLSGIEWTAISIMTWKFGFRPAAVFLCYHIAEVVLHRLRRKFVNGALESDLPSRMRESLLWFARIYFVFHALRELNPRSFSKAVTWIFWASVLAFFLFLCFWSWWSSRLQRSRIRRNNNGELIYQKLESLSTFRLLKIYPSILSSRPIRCELVHVESVESAPAYYTISYRWDTAPGKIKTIVINGESICTYPNVESILKDFRSAVRTTLVWIDQICIDQNNKAEKSVQVGMMDEIYASSLRVIVCLPHPNVTSYGYLSELRRYFQIRLSPGEADVHRADKMIIRLRNSTMLQDYVPSDSGNSFSLGELEDWKSLGRLVGDPWFTRVWIIQEIALARQVTLRYGNLECSWNQIVLAMAALARSEMKRFPEMIRIVDPSWEMTKAPGVENGLILQNLRDWQISKKPLSLLDNLILCLRFEATNNRDKVYALLGLSAANDLIAAKTVPDYTLSTPEIFSDLAIRLLSNATLRKQYRVLRFAGIGQRKPQHQKGDPTLPSWTPDWSAGLHTSSFQHRDPSFDFKASAMSDQPAGFDKDNASQRTFAVRGCQIDYVKLLVDVSEIPNIDSSTTPFLNALSAAERHSRKPYFTDQPVEEAFWRTILADTHPLTRPAPDDYWQHWKDTFTRFDEGRNHPRDPQDADEVARLHRVLLYLSSDDLRFTHLLATDLSRQSRDRGGGVSDVLNRSFDISYVHEPRVSQGRQFCITKKGYMGLVPRYTEIGDHVVILDGAMTPHILRHVLGKECDDNDPFPAYYLVGEAYVHGLMGDNEALLCELRRRRFWLL